MTRQTFLRVVSNFEILLCHSVRSIFVGRTLISDVTKMFVYFNMFFDNLKH